MWASAHHKKNVSREAEERASPARRASGEEVKDVSGAPFAFE